MAHAAAYVSTRDLGDEPGGVPATAVVEVDGAPVDVVYWPSLIPQWGKAGVRAYLEATALAGLGYGSDAHAVIQPLAASAPWAAQWIGENPLPVVMESDPLT